jgi:hypothetical protein
VTLYHYTCAHVRGRLGRRAMLRPQPQPVIGDVRLIWLTDQATPDRAALGLTSNGLDCDRLAHRYLVDVDDAVTWHDWKRRLDQPAIARLESVPGVDPARWFVLTRSALAILDRGYPQ